MNGLIAVPPAPASPAGAVVTAGTWWPSIDANAFRDAFRLGEVVTHDRLRSALVTALVAVTGELAEWKAARVAEGKASLAAIDPDDEIDGDPRLVVLFTQAVQFTAAAAVAEAYRDAAATNEAMSRSENQLQSAADFRRQATWAIRDIIGTTRTAVELI